MSIAQSGGPGGEGRLIFASPHVQAIYDYWNGLRRGRVAPDATDLDAVMMPRPALPYVLLVDLCPQPFRLCYRLVGTHGVSVFHLDYTQRFLDELDLPPEVCRQLHDHYVLAAARCMPVAGSYHWPLVAGGDTTSEYVVLPLLGRSGEVSRFLCGEHVAQFQRAPADCLVPKRMRA
jgi:hypothetical protein